MADQTSAGRRALVLQRLREVAPVLLEAPAPDAALPELLRRLVAAVRAEPGEGRLWLLFVAMTGAFATSPQLDDLRRRLTLADADDAVRVFLEETREVAGRSGDWTRPLRLVRDGTLIDVNFSARNAHNTGVQRVVREAVPHLLAKGGEREVALVAWTRENAVTRSLDAVEYQRATDWRALVTGTSVLPEGRPDELLVGWRSRILLPEVPEPDLCARMACLAEHSGNAVSIVGHDIIPIVSADMVTVPEANRFALYLSVVKHVRRVVTVSASVAVEFSGFADSLASQGLAGPKVRTALLAADVPEPGTGEQGGLPLVLCVGSHEPRKNQDAVLFAVETLLREGVRFRAVFVGGGSRDRTLRFDAHLRELRDTDGFDVRSVRGLPDAELWALYRDARFTVLTSLHEGFGLPVVESRALGTPVLTSNYGSLAEIAAQGGCVTVDPRDDLAIVDAMRSMLLDDGLVARLEREIAGIPGRSWATYADEVWEHAQLGVAP